MSLSINFTDILNTVFVQIVNDVPGTAGCLVHILCCCHLIGAWQNVDNASLRNTLLGLLQCLEGTALQRTSVAVVTIWRDIEYGSRLIVDRQFLVDGDFRDGRSLCGIEYHIVVGLVSLADGICFAAGDEGA